MNKIIEFFKKNYLRFFGIILFIIILFNINITQTFNIIKNVNLLFIFFIILFSFIKTFLKSIRLNYLLNILKIKFSIKKSLFITYISSFLGSIIPSNMSEFFKIIFIKNELNISSFRLLPGVFFYIILDFFLLLISSIIGIISLNFNINIFLIIIFILCLVILFIFLLNERIFKKSIYLFSKLLLKIFPKINLYKKYFKYINNYTLSLKYLKNIKIIIIICLTLIIYFILVIQTFLIGKSLDLNISFINYIYIISIINLISLLPVTISGLGTSQLICIYILNYYSISKEHAIAFSLLILIFINSIPRIIGFILWNIKPMKLLKNKKE